MKQLSSIEECIAYRMTESEDNYYYVTLWNTMISIAEENMPATYDFIDNCTDEELWWFCEVIDEIYEHTNDREFLNRLLLRAEAVAAPDRKKEILADITEIGG